MDDVVLYYVNGRGRMESIRWLLTAAEVDFKEVLVENNEQYQKLQKDGDLMFQQLPLVEMDGMKLVQTKAILNYIAEKYNLRGKDMKEHVKVDMYSEGLMDLMEKIMMLPFTGESAESLEAINAGAKGRYLPVYEKALAGQVYLVGDKWTKADVLLLECSLTLEEKFPMILADFPNIKCFQQRMCNIPCIQKFLQPGSKRKPPPDEGYLQMVRKVFNF